MSKGGSSKSGSGEEELIMEGVLGCCPVYSFILDEMGVNNSSLLYSRKIISKDHLWMAFSSLNAQ